jgi:predicted RNA-binding protein YlqC (UPF0109 family)
MTGAYDDEETGYEEGDINTVAEYEDDDVNTVVEYEDADVNTVAQSAAAPGADDAAGASMPVEVLDYIARSLADDPEAVVIRTEERRNSMVLRLHVAPSDMGRVIGRRGRTAQAIRTLVAAAGARGGLSAVVDIADD